MNRQNIHAPYIFCIIIICNGSSQHLHYYFHLKHTTAYTVEIDYPIIGLSIQATAELEIVTQICSANLSEHSKSCSAIARF